MNKKIILTLFFVALIPRLIFMTTAFFALDDQAFADNQDGYLNAGLNFLKQGVYTGEITEPLTPHSFPAPGYPILLALSWLLIPKYIFIIFWQNILYALVIVFIYKLARLFFNNFISLGAALLMAFEPFSFFWSNVVMSETAFLLAFILSIYFLALFWRQQKWKHIIVSAICLGLAALIRPIASLFYPVIAASTIVMFWRKINWLKLAKILIVYLFIFLLVTAPWCIRNKIRFNTYTISNIAHYLYFLGAARDFLSLSEGISREEADARLQNLAVQKAGVENFKQILYVDKYIPIFKEINWSLIKARPFTYLKWHLIKSLPVLTDSGWMNILLFWRVKLGQADSTNLTNSLSQGNWSVLISSLKNNRLFLIRILGICFWLLLNLLAFLGAILMLLKKKLRGIALVMLMIIAYFVFASSWAAMARFRLPFQPFLFIFVIYAIFIFYRKYIKKDPLIALC